VKTVGVLGGMGPAATLDFMAKLLAATHAKSDQDHVHLLVDLNPQVENRNEALAGIGPSPEASLVAMAQGLERGGAQALVIVCNSAHAWADPIRAATSIPLIDLIEKTGDAVLRDAPEAKRVGLLAASAALDAQLYQKALIARGVEPVVLEGADRDRFMKLLYKLKAGETGPAERTEMRALAQLLMDRGATAVVSACTEVPLVLAQADLPFPLIDSTNVLVAETLAFAKG
jgi:aspartate racemase